MIVNGVTLPDIPAEVLAEYPYAVITHTVIYGTDVYSLAVSSQPFDHGSAELLGQEMLLTHGEGQNYMLSNGVWDDLGTTSHSPFGVQLGEITAEGMTMEYTLVWTNQTEFKEIVWIDLDTMEWGTEPKEEKPTRVSIGRSLVDGYAKEVQRLTGTTEQMNAIQIREKLSTVKAGIKIGDVVLPAIPEDLKAKFSYFLILSVDNPNGSAMYAVIATKLKTVFVPTELGGSAADSDGGLFTEQLCLTALYVLTGTEWVYGGETDNDAPIFHIGGTTGTDVVWSNYDIYTATAYNSETKVPTAGTEIYFSERQNFNGVWLPKAPDDFFGEKPYGFLFRLNYNGENQYFLVKSHGEFLFLPEDVLGQIGLDPSILGGAVGFVTSEIEEPLSTLYCSSESTNWMTGNDQENAVPIGQFGEMYYYELLWANHDIYEVASVDMNGGGFIPGDLYYPPLPAIDTDRVSIGYDLCDGIVEEVQRLSGESEKMNALHAYWKLTTVAAVVTVTDDNTNSGIVIDGVSFPDLPEVNFPYAFIAYHTAGYYYLQYSREPYYADYWKTNSTTANPYYKYSSTSVYYDENDGRIFRLPSAGIGVESIWADYTNESSGMALISYNNKNTQVVWSNYDIYFNYPDNTIAFHSSV